MKAAAHALLKLVADPKYVGGALGFLVVLHTWGGALVYHPHVHCLIPGGAFNKQEQTWNRSRNDYLVPVKALSPIFRAKFLGLAAKEFPELALPYAVRQKKWVVYSKPTGQSPEKVVEYLGRYVFRAAITNARILEVDDKTVTFRYKKWSVKKKKGARAQWRTMQLPIFEFMRRFLQHTLPLGFHKVRYYGLLSPANKLLRHRILLLLHKPVPEEDLQQVYAEPESDEPTTKIRPCPHLRQGLYA